MVERMTPLQDQLDEITSNTRKLVQAERMAVGERAVEELFATGIEERILPVRRDGAGICAEGFEWKSGTVGGPARNRAAGDQVLSRAVVPLLHDRA